METKVFVRSYCVFCYVTMVTCKIKLFIITHLCLITFELRLGTRIKFTKNKNSGSFITIKQNINEIIKQYYLIMMAEANADNVDKKSLEIIKADSKVLTPTVAKRFSLITNANIENELNSMEKIYQRCFWKILCKFNGIGRISPETIDKLLKKGTIDILHLLENEKIVKLYGVVIAQYLKDNVRYVNQLVCEFLEKKNDNHYFYYFPSELTNEDKIDMIRRYIDSGNASLNVLFLLSTSKNNEQLPIPTELRLKSHQVYKIKEEEICKKAISISNGVEITFKIQKETVSERFENFDIYCSYDIRWVLNNLDYPTLFNNFIYLFKFTDQYFRSLHISKKSTIGIVEQLTRTQGKKCYLHSSTHECTEMKAQVQLSAYRSLLKKSGINVEDMIYWFFNNYLPNEFNVNGFVYNKPSDGANILELCRSIAIEIDSILKQFKLYCQYKEINRELFEFSTEHMLIQNIPSMLPGDKYIYPEENRITGIFNCLFSSQAIMLYVPDIENWEKLYDILLSGYKVCYSSLENHQKNVVDYIIKQGIMSLDINQNLIFSKKLLWLMHDLYTNEFQCCSYLMDEFHTELQFLKDNGFISFGKSLLSIPEQKYFNYIFNSSEFDDSKDLRNIYAHGNQSLDKDVMFNDYITMLRMMILIVIKINEEFCLKTALDPKA